MGARRVAIGVIAVLTSSVTTASASSPASWASYRSEVVAKCIGASGLKDAKLIGSLVEYDDTVGYSAAMIGGTYPQAHMKGQSGRSLCLFDKRTRTAHTAPADDLK